MMEMILIYISMAILLIYAAFGLFIFMGFYVPANKKKNRTGSLFISMVIPFRNEEKNLPALIESIKNLNYPADQFEVIFVNDHSTDQGPAVIQQSGLSNFYLFHSTGEGKKAAIAQAVEHAKGELIAATDADCLLPQEWLKEIHQAGNDSFILGPVQLGPIKSFLHQFQEIELAALQSISASAVNWKMPMMSNGANMAYKKGDFKEVGLKKETASGDDIFLLEDFKKRKLPIHFLWNPTSIVKTLPVNSLKELVQQKVRWASKSKYYKNYSTTGLGILIALINLVMLANYIHFVLPGSVQNYALMVIITKAIIDLIIILPYIILIKKPHLIFMVPAFALLYPFYFFYVLVLSIRGKFTWKERNYHA